jgi:50S ribosomal protein L16 3-hydroxylase
MKPGLRSLFDGTSNSQFIRKYRPHSPFVVHRQSKLRKYFLEFPELRGIANLFAREWNSSISAALPDARDEISSISVNAQEARKLYRNGLALSFIHAERSLPTLQKWLSTLVEELALPRNSLPRSTIYAIPDGSGTHAHFDANANFVIQLHGTKRWTLAPNRQVENPRHRFTMNTPAYSKHLNQANLPFPETMPTEGRTEVTLAPGSVLFVPRGWWHSTEASGETIALNFTFAQPDWIDVLLPALAWRLSRHSDWRELATGLESSKLEVRRKAQKRYQSMLDRLVADVSALDAEALIRDFREATSADSDEVFQANPRARLSRKGVSIRGKEGLESVEIDGELRAIAAWAFRRKTPFTRWHFLDQFAKFDENEADRILTALRTEGILV